MLFVHVGQGRKGWGDCQLGEIVKMIGTEFSLSFGCFKRQINYNRYAH